MHSAALGRLCFDHHTRLAVASCGQDKVTCTSRLSVDWPAENLVLKRSTNGLSHFLMDHGFAISEGVLRPKEF